MIKKEWKNFRSNFFEECCKQISASRAKVTPGFPVKTGNNQLEDQITYQYVENMRKNCFEKGISVSCCSKEKKGDNSDELVNPDINFSTPDNRLKTFFECKILGSNYKYISEGLKRFVKEKYGSQTINLYGMLGYVRDDNSAVDCHKKLKKIIESKKNDLKMADNRLVKNSNPEVIFTTNHRTEKGINNKKIKVCHILHHWRQKRS